ncbi:protein containing Pumilio domain [Mycoavidus cysteinexigens]|uniref:Protein containing Pumilio domain n=1 Tax=Mycoavidus cysteinexigens TaxID=1553431 RepID=A0A2Z6EU40_9BURK|nr:hypothetical protein [Mycoavidus cysteinexigens]BBE08959.1 protein containing Pumilio domain [Mycoavidus cysteinexigens]GAM52318.1 hypothetical protein EBME_0781 [bacterium endosymbiont of Mortierella elongata FMR23-6]GLR01196.1 hypothetical protein GCM10007934_10080 [Mycoavidus cysteinexigens]
MKKEILIVLLIVKSWVTGCGGGSSSESTTKCETFHPLSCNESQFDHADLLSRFKNFPTEEKIPSFTLGNGQAIIGFRKDDAEIKDILILPISYSSKEAVQYIKSHSNWLGENLIEIKILDNKTRDNIKFKFLAIEKGNRPIEPTIDRAALIAIFSLISKRNGLINWLSPEIIEDSNGNYWLEYSLSEASVYSPPLNLSDLSSNKVDADHAVRTDFSLSERQAVSPMDDSTSLEDDRLIAFTVVRISYKGSGTTPPSNGGEPLSIHELYARWDQARSARLKIINDNGSDSDSDDF